MGTTLSMTRGTDMTTSTTRGLSADYGFEVTEKIPEVLDVTEKVNFDISMSTTTAQKVSEASTTSVAVYSKLKQGELGCAHIEMGVLTYSSTFDLPMSLEGRILCAYDYKCGDHYALFADL